MDKGMSEIVKTVCRVIEGFIFVFGLYIVLFGHLTPGGGFGGGVILAGIFVLILLSYGKNAMAEKVFAFFESFGALIFITFAFLGIIVMKSFFANFLHRLFGGLDFRFLSAGNIPVYNIGIGIKVMAELYGIIFVLSITHIMIKKRRKK